MRVFGAVVGLLMVSGLAYAQTPADQVLKCAAITDQAVRLGCYDDIAKALANPPPIPAAAGEAGKVGNWNMAVETDPITDQKGVTFRLLAQGSEGIDSPNLVIRCRRGDLDAYVSPEEYLGDNNNRVILRFGDEPPVEQRWTEASTHTALFHPGGRSKIEEFIRKLSEFERLVVQVTPYNQSPMAMVFDLKGITQVNEQLWVICPSKKN